MGDYTVLEDTSEEDESDENAIQMWQVKNRTVVFSTISLVSY